MRDIQTLHRALESGRSVRAGGEVVTDPRRLNELAAAQGQEQAAAASPRRGRQPAAEKPATDAGASAESGGGKPATEQPATEKPATDDERRSGRR